MSRRSRALGRYSSYNPRSKFKTRIFSLLKSIVLLFIIYQLITFFIVSSFTAGTSAMEPGLVKNQKILSTPVIQGKYLKIPDLKIPGIRSPERGDVVIIRPGNSEQVPWYTLMLDPLVRFFTLQKKTLMSGDDKPWNNQIAVKRIIALPGDTVKLDNYRFFIKPQGQADYLPENQVTDKNYEIIVPPHLDDVDGSVPFYGNMEGITVADDSYFVANDNRSMQYDSRFYGPVSAENILGTVFFSY